MERGVGEEEERGDEQERESISNLPTPTYHLSPKMFSKPCRTIVPLGSCTLPTTPDWYEATL